MGPFFADPIQNNLDVHNLQPIQSINLVLNRTRILCATNYSNADANF